MKIKLTYLGGATYLIEAGSFRFLTDPGFDPKGTERSEGPGHDLKKTMDPPVPAEQIGRIDAVFLSHAHHYDNLDNAGRAMLPRWGRVFTTPDGADFLGGSTEALRTWETVEITSEHGETVRVTGLPAVHTTNQEIRQAVGETMGFLLEWDDPEADALYISGDTVWADDIEEIGRRFKIRTAILNMGAANVPAVGDIRLTMNGEEGARVTKTLGIETAFPAHFEGWEHYLEGADGIREAFAAAGLTERLKMLDPGQSAEAVV